MWLTRQSISVEGGVGVPDAAQWSRESHQERYLYCSRVSCTIADLTSVLLSKDSENLMTTSNQDLSQIERSCLVNKMKVSRQGPHSRINEMRVTWEEAVLYGRAGIEKLSNCCC